MPPLPADASPPQLFPPSSSISPPLDLGSSSASLGTVESIDLPLEISEIGRTAKMDSSSSSLFLNSPTPASSTISLPPPPPPLPEKLEFPSCMKLTEELENGKEDCTCTHQNRKFANKKQQRPGVRFSEIVDVFVYTTDSTYDSDDNDVDDEQGHQERTTTASMHNGHTYRIQEKLQESKFSRRQFGSESRSIAKFESCYRETFDLEQTTDSNTLWNSFF